VVGPQGSNIGSRRSAVVLYSHDDNFFCHQVRLVLAEKGIDATLITVVPGTMPEGLGDIPSNATLPILVDRDLVLYNARVIIDYLDERYPHPPLMPADPISRARTRLTMHRIDSEWISLRPGAIGQTMPLAEAKRQLTESLSAAADVFSAMNYFFSEEYSILDATLAPLLWRLPSYGILLPERAASIRQYAKRIFSRPGFQASLSNAERELAQ
jgi:RNA polymerase-associated protein